MIKSQSQTIISIFQPTIRQFIQDGFRHFFLLYRKVKSRGPLLHVSKIFISSRENICENYFISDYFFSLIYFAFRLATVLEL